MMLSAISLAISRPGSLPFDPRGLFAAGEPGAWYDPADFSTLFQDAAGTTPVTALGQPVGRVLDKSGRGNHLVQTTTTSRPTINQDASGFYLQYDGVDDWLQSAATVNLSTTDKVMVVAGLRKLSDAARGVLVELGPLTTTNGFLVDAPGPTGATQRYRFASAGSALSVAETSQGPAPDLAVLAGIGDIAADISTLRRNGVFLVNQSSDQGTGNYGNATLFVGRRGGTTLPYNGRLNGLIIRGTASTPEQIANAERWMAQRTGVTL